MELQKLTQFEERFSNLSNRQKNKDSTFLYGVTSTGIFCLSHCPSKLPKPENVLFFNNVTEALDQGFRSCKRCKPHLSFHLAVDNDHERILSAALTQISEKGCRKVGDLAKSLNISERQLYRIFKTKTGRGTLAFIKSQS